MNSHPPPDAERLSQQRPFIYFWFTRVATIIGYQMLTVAVGWQVYALTGSAFDLGLVGLVQFLPSVLLLLLAGHVRRCSAQSRSTWSRCCWVAQRRCCPSTPATPFIPARRDSASCALRQH